MPSFGDSGRTSLTTCAGILALLDETDSSLKVYALRKLNDIVDVFWAEIADSIARIESLYEDEKFESRELAALVASKVFYHLGEYNDSLTYALGARELFNVASKDEYVETLVAKCIDEYISLRVAQADGAADAKPIDARLEAIVEKMFDRCFADQEYRQAAGIAIEARRLEKMEEAIRHADAAVGTPKDVNGVRGMLSYCLQISQTHVYSRSFRHKLLRALVQIYQELAQPDYLNTCQALMFLDDHAGVAAVLDGLLRGGEEHELLAYQVAFDLADNELQHFLLAVRDTLTAAAAPKPAPELSADAAAVAGSDTPAAAMEVESAAEPSEAEKAYSAKLAKLKQVLSGEIRMALHLEFLFQHNHSDLLLLKQMKGSFEARNSVCHSGVVFANALMHCGTTSDTFLRENMDWLKKATNWAKFSATAALGMIYKGHVKESLNALSAYLPQGGGAMSSPYSEGGALFGLGLIHANHGEDITKYLLTKLRDAGTQEVVQHGASLGLGLAAMATCNEEIYEDLRGVVYTDSAVAGEAAGIAMGLVMLGSASDKAIDELLAYAHDTQHEKIIRGVAIGMALIMYGREESADTLIEQLTLDKDPILRYGGMFTIALAYCATANNSAIRRLLHVAVSDVSDDVRRAAVIALGFVLASQPEQCPRVVALLSESYNAHVRYGATMAVGIACAGTGMREAIELLEPMTTDPVDYVRQGALIALAMVLVQVSEGSNSKVASVRKSIEKVYTDKHEDVMAKFGALLASGIIDAGGRNVTIALRSESGFKRMPAVVGMAIFLQYWYWFPLVHFISLTFKPTPLIGLNASLKMPALSVTSNCAPSQFAYPPMTKEATKEAATKVKTAVLSTTVKAKARAKKDATEKEKPGAATDAKMDDAPVAPEGDAAAPMAVDGADAKKKAKEPEPTSEVLRNPARVLPAQAKFIEWDAASRYQPVVKLLKRSGIVMLSDTTPSEAAEYVEIKAPAAPGTASASAIVEDEPAPPEPFEYVDADGNAL